MLHKRGRAMKMNVHLSLKSSNAKTGPIPVSTTSARTCPPSCIFNRESEGGCYAESGPLALHWRKVTEGERGMGWGAFCDAIGALPEGQLWRHNQAGDLPGEGDAIDAVMLDRLVQANAGKRGFTYTHKPMDRAENRDAVQKANARGFTINLSANNLQHADQLASLEIAPVVAVVPEGTPEKTTTPEGRTVIVCPAQTREDVSCATCQLCSRRDRRGIIVGFIAHGTAKRKVNAIAARRVD